MEPLVSIVIPIYNVERYINKCIDTIINQTYSNLEIILIDDGSTDDSGRICEEYSLKDKRIKVIHKKNSGVSSARNDGIKAATGDYIYFIDSDDFVELDLIKTAVLSAVENNSDVVVWGYTKVYVDKNDCFLKSIIYVPDRICCSVDKISSLSSKINDELLGILGYVWNKLYRLEIIKRNHILFEENTSLYEDILFNVLVLTNIKIINFIDESYIHYMQRSIITLSNIVHNNLFDLNIRACIEKKHLLECWNIDAAIIENSFEKSLVQAIKSIIKEVSISSICRREKINYINSMLKNYKVKRIIDNIKTHTFKDKIIFWLLKHNYINSTIFIYKNLIKVKYRRFINAK
ncbi:MAG: glycosyltransferase [Clostridiaceae bacterium]